MAAFWQEGHGLFDNAPLPVAISYVNKSKILEIPITAACCGDRNFEDFALHGTRQAAGNIPANDSTTP
jgi:hypothetical protein